MTSFPGNSERGLPVVTGALLLSDAETGELLAIIDCASITSLRTGAAAAVSAQVLGADDAESVGHHRLRRERRLGGALPGGRRLRPGRLRGRRTDAAEALAAELGWRSADRAEAAAQDVVVTVTPGAAPVIHDSDLRPGQHLAVLGADADGKAEVELAALERCRLFCDEWAQASAGGELSGAVAAGRVDRDEVTQIGDVIARPGGGPARGRRRSRSSTRPASRSRTSAIAIAVYEAWREGRIDASLARL